MELEPIFGDAKAEWSAPGSPPLRPFLFHVHADASKSVIRFDATDFHSNAFEAVRSIEQLEDMRDMIGIGGSWSEFINYIIASFKSDDVKLILDGKPRPDGATHAKIIAQRSKGMPVISIPLARLVDAAARDVMANLSLELYKAFKSMSNSFINDLERSCQFTKQMSAEQENFGRVPQRQHITQEIGDKANSDVQSLRGLLDSPAKSVTQSPSSSNVTKHVVPAYRRVKKRGALLEDTEDE